MYSVIIRPFDARDSSDIIRIDSESFSTMNPTYDLFIYMTYGSEILVADIGNAVVGYVVISYREEEAKIMSLAVKKEFRGKGIGKMLLREIIKKARSRGVKRLTLEVRISNRIARELYKKMGFEIAGVIESYYSDGESAYLMCLNLNDTDNFSQSWV